MGNFMDGWALGTVGSSVLLRAGRKVDSHDFLLFHSDCLWGVLVGSNSSIFGGGRRPNYLPMAEARWGGEKNCGWRGRGPGGGVPGFKGKKWNKN